MRVLALTLLLGIAPAVRADDKGLKPFYDFVVESGGVVDPGWKLYAPQMKTKILLVSPAKDQYLMLSVTEKSVRPVDRTLTKTNADGSIDVLAGSISTTRMIPLVQSGSNISFSLDVRTLVLKPRPPLVGPHTVNELISDRPTFGEGIQKYQPEAAAVSYLKNYSKPTEIEIFFGSWCSVCEAWVPKFLKSLSEAGNSKIQYQLIGVAHEYPDIAKSEGVRGLPTFIIRQNGIEVGRIVGAPQTGTVEGALAEVLRAKSDDRPSSSAAPGGDGRSAGVKAARPAPQALPVGRSIPKSPTEAAMGTFGDMFGKKDKPKADFSDVQSVSSSTAPAPVPAASQPETSSASAVARTYTVVSGDSLSKTSLIAL